MSKYFTDSFTEAGLVLNSISIVGIGFVILGGNFNAKNFLELTINVILLDFAYSSTRSNS